MLILTKGAFIFKQDEGDGNQASKGAMAISRAQFERNLQMFMLSGKGSTFSDGRA